MSVDRCMLLTGDDEFLKERALKRYREQLKQQGLIDTNYHVFYGSDLNFSELSSLLKMSSLFGSVSLCLMRDCEQIDKQLAPALASTISAMAPGMYLVLMTGKKNLSKAVYSAISPLVKTVTFRSGYKRDDIQHIKQIFSDRGMAITGDAIERIFSTIGRDLRQIDTVAEQVSVYTGNKKRVDAQDIEKFLFDQATHTAFDLTNSVGNKDATESIRILKRLTAQGSSSPEIIGALSWYFSRVFKGKIMAQKRSSSAAIGEELRINKYFLNNFIKQMGNYTIDECRDVFHKLLEADLASKSTRFDARVDLEVLILDICGAHS